MAKRKLISLRQWRAEKFDPASAPTDRTIRNWAVKGHIPAIKIGSLWFIDPDAQAQLTGNELADAVLRAS